MLVTQILGKFHLGVVEGGVVVMTEHDSLGVASCSTGVHNGGTKTGGLSLSSSLKFLGLSSTLLKVDEVFVGEDLGIILEGSRGQNKIIFEDDDNLKLRGVIPNL